MITMTASRTAPRIRPLPWRLALTSVLCLLVFTSNVKPSQAFLCPRTPALAISSSRHLLISSSSRDHHQQPSSSYSSFCSSPTTEINASKKSTTALKYASRAASADDDGGPMSKVDSNKGGGCPFLDTSYVYKTYAVPALFNEEDSRPIVLFDGDCNMCNKFVQTLLKYDSCSDDERGNLRFAALQSRVGDLLLRRMSDELRAEVLASDSDVNEGGEERFKSIVLCGSEKTFIKSSAAFQILQSMGGSSKRLKVVQYLALLGYVLPTRARDRVYKFISKRRKKWFGSADECLLWDDRFETRFVDDGVLTGTYRDPFADPHAKVVPTSINLFEGDSPPVRGDKVRIIWPADSDFDPSVSFDDEFPDGVLLASGTGTLSTIDLPTRVVMRVDRKSIGLGPDEKGEETMIAWVKPQEVAI